MSVKPIPEGFSSVTPAMNVKGAAQAIEFYKRAFGAVEQRRMLMPDDNIMYAEIRIGNAIVTLSEAIREPVQTLSAMIYTENCDAMIKRAQDAGGTVLMPAQDMFWGDRGGRVRDPFGNHWWIATHKQDVSDDEVRKRMAQMVAQQQQ